MFSVIGIVMLMGLVTKNAILLVDFAIRGAGRRHGPQPRRCCWRPRCGCAHPDDHAGHDLRHGAAGFCADRGLGIRAPMGQAVIGGVITSSLLTLVVVPVVYCIWMTWRDGWAGAGARTGRAATALPG